MLIDKILFMEAYDNLLDAIEGLKEQGYVEDFNLKENCLVCGSRQLELQHEHFQIDKVFRFDVDTDPADQSVIYAISSDLHDIKGILINGYGLYTDKMSNEMLAKLTIVD